MREEKKIMRPDMINILLESRNGKLCEESNNELVDSFTSTNKYSLSMKTNNVELTNETITAQVLIFLFAGSDTTSYAMSFLSFELAMNNNIQDKLREEINATWKECKGNLTYKTLISMTYMDMVISEVLRKWPLFHFWTEDATRIIQFKLQNQYFGK
ncbi:PREDICTED: cytochrome P450 9e2-like isoform X1 [Nicrophorus vespilloides]|uniref:Cytochrome P450 9e2-like isoform X1 n=1 Tax=Nicrophorus vespilloides TaxID=110193 RepID=A0ABM1M4G2_NICVS|nr:PREDICTED: cytochrome P450 9e2-like isoform X1 [Nicrophorus vespilloides]